MAVDAALFELAEQPTLRLYGWQPHAVSLGYFQSIAAFADLPEGTVIVRRATGGGAIHHGDELTFSLALPSTSLPQDIAKSYVVLHDAIVRALASIGVACHRAADGHPATARPSHRWCFASPVQGDLITEHGKLLGSAQRRGASKDLGARVLHHGSLVLAKPQHTPFVAAVADQVALTDALREQLQRAIVTELAEVLGAIPEPGEHTETESAMAARLCRERFGKREFIRRR